MLLSPILNLLSAINERDKGETYIKHQQQQK